MVKKTSNDNSNDQIRGRRIMRIAFDIDGVILDIDLGLIRTIDFIEDEKKRAEASLFYYTLRKPQINPCDYIHEDDELYIITGRDEKYRDITERWVKKYYPMAKLIILGHEEPNPDTNLEKWFIKQARKKAEALIENKIDVYFEDTPPVIREMRKILPQTIKVIQYGGRFDL